jgi:hypothetical protein
MMNILPIHIGDGAISALQKYDVPFGEFQRLAYHKFA